MRAPEQCVCPFLRELRVGTQHGRGGPERRRHSATRALRTGSGEGVQSQFPLLFFATFVSSMNLPRNRIEVRWFRDVATINPVRPSGSRLPQFRSHSSRQ